jgi:hypothetical protein
MALEPSRVLDPDLRSQIQKIDTFRRKIDIDFPHLIDRSEGGRPSPIRRTFPKKSRSNPARLALSLDGSEYIIIR